MARKQCDIHQLTALLGKKWTFPIMFALKPDTDISTFTDIDKSTSHSISPRALSKSLKELFLLGIIDNKTYGRSIVYSLSDNGKKLLNVMKMLRGWCSMNELKVPKDCNLKCIQCQHFK